METHDSFIEINNNKNTKTIQILNYFNNILKAKNNGVNIIPKYTTHIIEYIYSKKDLVKWTYIDLDKLLKSSHPESKCIIDIMMFTKNNSYFIHIENGIQTRTRIKSTTFFTKELFEQFMNIIKISRMGHTHINTIFVFGGHCNGWACYTEDYIVDMKMIREMFIKHKLKIDMICFDCCYTSTLELIYQFKDCSKYIMAHQTYVYGEGFNTKDISKIFDNNMPFLYKIIVSSLDYLVRSIKEKEYANVTIIDCKQISHFFNLYKQNYNQIQMILRDKNIHQNKYYTDMCTKWLGDCKNMSDPPKNCYQSECNNIMDLYYIIRKLKDGDKMLKIYNQSVFAKHNGIPVNTKYYHKGQRLKGLNVIINPIKDKSDKKYEEKYDTAYKNLEFYKDFIL